MNKYIFALVCILFSVTVYADSISNIDKFQSQINKCVMGNGPNVCLNNLLPRYYVPGNEESAKTIPQVTAFLMKWLGGDTVYAVHPIKVVKIGSLSEKRIQVIEGNQGGFMVLQTSYIRIHGKLYLLKFNLSSTDETINALLNDKL